MSIHQTITGIRLRKPNGEKLSVKDSTDGLFIPADLGPCEQLLIAEGASDTAALLDLGFDVVGRPSCSSGVEHVVALVKAIRPARIVIVADRDKHGQGQHGAEALASKLLAHCTSVKVILPPKGIEDARAWKRSGVTHERIQKMIDETAKADPASQSSGLVLTCMADIDALTTEWLWLNRIPLGTVTMVVGQQGDGKTHLMLDVAARVSAGRPFPDQLNTPNPAGGVFLLTAEDDPARTLRPRLDAAAADVKRIHLIEAVRRGTAEYDGWFSLQRDIPLLGDAIERCEDVRLVVIDPITAYLGGIDDNSNAGLRAMLAPLTKLAEEKRFALVAISHLNKMQSANSLHRVMGSTAYTAAARAVWLVTQDAKDVIVPPRRLFLSAKMNLTEQPSGLAFRIEGGTVQWSPDPVNMTANEALAEQVREPGKRTKKQEAVDWLRKQLADGPVLKQDVLKSAEEAGFSEATIGRASRDLGLDKRPSTYGAGWLWSLSAQSVPDQQSAHSVDHTLKLVHTDHTGADGTHRAPSGANAPSVCSVDQSESVVHTDETVAQTGESPDQDDEWGDVE